MYVVLYPGLRAAHLRSGGGVTLKEGVMATETEKKWKGLREGGKKKVYKSGDGIFS